MPKQPNSLLQDDWLGGQGESTGYHLRFSVLSPHNIFTGTLMKYGLDKWMVD